MSNLCIIPARGGSKRIPRKNIRPFHGKPIIAYSIQTALQSGIFDEVMVSTDDAEIAEVARKYGANVPFMRSAKNADHHATLADVVHEVLEHYRGKFEYSCCLLPTAPLVTIEHLKMGLDLLTSNDKADSVRPIARFSYPVQRVFKLLNGKVERMYPEFETLRSQDLEPAYHDAGQFYWMRPGLHLKSTNKFGFEISNQFVQDIDTEDDWKMAELKYQMLQSR